MKRAIQLILLLASILPMQAAGHDSLRISLLTCGPGEAIYSLFGHTAILCENYTQGKHKVYNYGTFDFDAPNFVLRFTLGETDYLLGRTDIGRFAYEYRQSNRNVWMQVLNLTQEEKERLVAALEENYRPEKREYRYNFFYDNCATRPRDKIEEALTGTLHYAEDMETRDTGMTFRHLLHRYTEGHDWSRLGIDLCMGAKADRPITRREAMFVPFLLQEAFAKAEVTDSAGSVHPLVLAEREIIASEQREATLWERMGRPGALAWALLAVVASASIYGYRRKKTMWGWDAALFAAAGVAGVIPTFLACFSQHPAVNPNYILFVFHPLHLLCLPWMISRVRKGKLSRYMVANLAVLTLFILLWQVIPQVFPPEVLPLALCLLMRSLCNVLTWHTRKR